MTESVCLPCDPGAVEPPRDPGTVDLTCDPGAVDPPSGHRAGRGVGVRLARIPPVGRAA